MRGNIRSRWAAVLALTAGLLLPATGARAVENTDPATAGPVRTVSYNVCGASFTCQSKLPLGEWATAVTDQVTAWDADAVMLQELCAGQYEELTHRLVGYNGQFTRTLTAAADSNGPRCSKWDPTDAGYGIGLFVRSPAVDQFSASLTVPAGKEARAVQCARGPIDGRTTLVCNTHLADYIDNDGTPDGPTKVHELGRNDNGSGQVLAHLDLWAAGLPVILGGDFNATPGEGVLTPFMRGTAGTGPFADVDENDDTYPDGEDTTTGVGKIDYVFVSAPDFHSVSAAVLEPGLSDHKLLRGAAYPEKRAPSGVPGDLTGDGRPDLVAVKDDGTLRLYSGLGDGQVLKYRQIGNSGWTNALITHRGDWTGDGREDLVARIGDSLWIYPNTGYGELGARIPMGGRATGWTSTTAVLAPGDLDGDGHPDLVGRDANGLWLYRGDPAKPSGLTADAPVRLGGPEWAGYDLLAPGDATGDGKADLWARDRATGTLLGYPNTGSGTLGSPTAVSGGPWTAADRPLLATAGDADRDGRPDLWSTAADSSLLFHPGAAGGLATPVTVGSGGWQWILRLA